MKKLSHISLLVALLTSNSALAEDGEFVIPLYLKSTSSEIVASSEFLRVPKRPGPAADEKLINNVINLIALDKKLRNLDKNNFRPYEIDAYLEARNSIASEISNGKNILTGTAGGEFPASIQKSIDLFSAELVKALKRQDPKEYLETDITFPGYDSSTVSAQYISYSNWRGKIENWTTYNKGETLRIGTYIFSISSTESNAVCNEKVLILSQPAKRYICGKFKP